MLHYMHLASTLAVLHDPQLLLMEAALQHAVLQLDTKTFLLLGHNTVP